MKIVSVNVGMPREVVWKGMTVQTAIFKDPAAGSVRISKLNLAGDQQADLTVHGGSEKAVYAYPAEHYEYWGKELPEVPFSWGRFGENLTTEGLREGTLCIGDRLRIGSAVLMVTQPRMPCYKLDLRFDRDDMIKRFLMSGRSGFYFSVIEPGEVSVGSKVEILGRDANRVTVVDIVRLYLGQTRDPDLRQRAVNVSALPENWRAQLRLRARTDTDDTGS
jgi:MOSC domain-containing protein YiiM